MRYFGYYDLDSHPFAALMHTEGTIEHSLLYPDDDGEIPRVESGWHIMMADRLRFH